MSNWRSFFVKKKLYTSIGIIFLFLTINVQSINAQCSANANFISNFTQCSTVQFTDLSSTIPGYAIVQWDWDFGDGNTSNVPNPLYTYAPGATYVVTLTVTADSSGVTCTDQTQRGVTVPPLPNVYFSWSPEPTCLSDATSFFGTAGKPIVSWNWDFGDGEFSIIQNPVHLYTYSNIFNVVLTVLDTDGCSDTIIQQVIVVEIPDVTIIVDADPTCLNEITNFSGSSAAAVVSWDWTFGDGGISVGQNVTHVYSVPGNYPVTLIVTDTNGCTNNTVTQVTVNPLPTANFSHNGPACMSDSVTFLNLSTTPNGYIVTWDWDFGDGNSTTATFPASGNVSHLYANPGTFQVTLTVTDSDSCIHTTFMQVNVVANPIANFTNSTACDEQAVDFTDLSSPNGGGNIIVWFWEFADAASGVNNTSNLQHPTHLFTTYGSYNVMLVIENINGCADTISIPVTVNQLPIVSIATDSDTTCVGHSTNFYGSGANVISWFWDFGDGGTSVQQNPVHVYQSPGTYTVQLTGLDNNDCENDTTHEVFVNPGPLSDFNYTSPSCSESEINFLNLSSTPNGCVIFTIIIIQSCELNGICSW